MPNITCEAIILEKKTKSCCDWKCGITLTTMIKYNSNILTPENHKTPCKYKMQIWYIIWIVDLYMLYYVRHGKSKYTRLVTWIVLYWIKAWICRTMFSWMLHILLLRPMINGCISQEDKQTDLSSVHRKQTDRVWYEWSYILGRFTQYRQQ